jgi:hypothetical protein
LIRVCIGFHEYNLPAAIVTLVVPWIISGFRIWSCLG